MEKALPYEAKFVLNEQLDGMAVRGIEFKTLRLYRRKEFEESKREWRLNYYHSPQGTIDSSQFMHSKFKIQKLAINLPITRIIKCGTAYQVEVGHSLLRLAYLRASCKAGVGGGNLKGGKRSFPGGFRVAGWEIRGGKLTSATVTFSGLGQRAIG